VLDKCRKGKKETNVLLLTEPKRKRHCSPASLLENFFRYWQMQKRTREKYQKRIEYRQDEYPLMRL
jgi:hypothetical protein